MSNYSKGRAFEYEIKKLLEDAGFDVIRGSSSKGRLAGIDCDLVASKFTDKTKYELAVVVIQCKRSKRK